MSAPTPPAPRPSLVSVLLEMAKDRSFLLAAGVLLAAAVGWSFAVWGLKLVLHKEPVPWPAGAVVDEGFRLTSFPNRFPESPGLPARFQVTGLGKPDPKTGRPAGDIVHRKDVLDSMGVGTSLDRTRYDGRRSNWYLAKTFQDTDPRSPVRGWYLDVTYYTGALDLVPHVPERCLAAGGAQDVSTQRTRTFHIPDVPAPWDRVALNRTEYERYVQSRGVSVRLAQYYVFSLNGRPATSWEDVRLSLTNPFARYVYFSKIQFAPDTEVTDLEQMDRAAERFFGEVLPRILTALPTAEDVEKLGAGR